jgi:hypothetical protein
MTITVTAEELEEYPEVELPEVEFDAERVNLLLDVIDATRDVTTLNPFNQAASLSLAKTAKELKKELDEAMEAYRKACEEREAKILKARADRAKAEAEEKEDAA